MKALPSDRLLKLSIPCLSCTAWLHALEAWYDAEEVHVSGNLNAKSKERYKEELGPCGQYLHIPRSRHQDGRRETVRTMLKSHAEHTLIPPLHDGDKYC